MSTKPPLAPLLALALALLCPALLQASGQEAHGEEAHGEEVPAGGAALPRQALGVTSTLDWAARSLDFQVSLDLGVLGLRLPAGRPEAERLIALALPGILKDLVMELPVDARRNFGDCLADGSVEEGEVTLLSDRAEAQAAVFSRDFKHFSIGYRFPLSAVEALLVKHRTALLPPVPMEWRPTRAYTGIVIYAQGKLPVRGERVEASLEPCLFPRIYDEAMNLLMDRNAVAPEALAAWGEVAYATDLGPEAWARVGEAPLRIEAEAVFGLRRSDLLIPRDEALKILGLPENRALLAQGRVLIIVKKP